MLTNEQIDHLYTFCRKHSVTYYDVQVELVDHLANAIEEKIAAQPTLAFETALQQVYKGFGVMGFAPVIREKEKAVRKYNRKLMWGYFKAQWRWPKIFMALSVFGITYTAFTNLEREVVRIAAVVLFLIATFIVTREITCLRRMEKRSGKKFMLINLAGVINVSYAPFNFLIFIKEFRDDAPAWTQPHTIQNALILSACFALYAVLVVATYKSVKHIRQNLRETYPHLFTTAA